MAWSIFSNGGPGAAVTWSHDLLSQMGLPQTPQNVQFLYDWQKSEGGGGANNPLNQGPVPGQPSLTTSGSQYGGGAANFASTQAGLQGAADYLKMPAYQSVLKAMQAGNNYNAAAHALWSSPWAGGHYGYGKAWNTSAAPGQSPISGAGTLGAPLPSSGGATHPGASWSLAGDLGALGINAKSSMGQFFNHVMSLAGDVAGPARAAASGAALGAVGSPGGKQQFNLAVHDAMGQIGTPYQWGGTTPGKGLDCSGLVQYAWKQAGVNIPRTTYDQIAHLPAVHGGMSTWRPGDLVFPETGHVGMYIGNGKIVEAPYTGTRVQVVPVSGGWSTPVAVRRP